MDYKIPNILFLQGVKTSDYESPEDQFERLILEELIKTDIEKEEKRETIPEVFTSLETWKKSTTIPCWNCSCKFGTIPVFIPIYQKYIDDKLTIGVLGNFCHFSCAQNFINDHFKNSNLEYKYSYSLRDLYKIFYNVSIDTIKPAPNMYSLYEWGGKEYSTKEELQKCIQGICLEDIPNLIDTNILAANTWMDTLAEEILESDE
jgi:hypothetical protein